MPVWMMLLYPLRLVFLLLTLAASFLFWLMFFDIFSFLVVVRCLPLILTVLVYFKYLFVVLERTANGYTDAPVLTIEFYQPFTEMRPYQLLLVVLFVISLSVTLRQFNLDKIAIVLIAYFLCTLPAFIGLLGVRNGFFASLNPVVLAGFMLRIGLVYPAMLVILAAGVYLIFRFYRSDAGLFTAILVTLYGLDLVFLCIGRIIYGKRMELEYKADKSPEREAEKSAEALLLHRKHCLARVFKERLRENVLAVLLAHIAAEEDNLGAHAWYHKELMQWQNKRLAVSHAKFYIRALREAGKHIIADLIQQECRLIDPDFSAE